MRVSARTPVRAALVAAAFITVSSCARDDSSTTPTSTTGIQTNLNATGSPLPDVDLQTTSGRTVSTASFRNRPLLVNFWYSTCEPCRREMPALAEAYAEFGDRVEFIGVNMSDPAVVAQNFADRYGVTFPILLDEGSALTLRLGISIAPTTLFVDADGVIVDQVSGELSAEKIAAHLTELAAP